jgi:glycolate oxidase FAD binding subunit
MARAMGSSCTVAAATHVPRRPDSPALTALRLEGFPESVEARARQLCDELAAFGSAAVMAQDHASDFWSTIRQGEPIWSGEAIWRAHLPPSRSAAFARAIEQSGGEWYFDWAGASAWVGTPAGFNVRAAATACEGHAMLLRGPLPIRAYVPARQPEGPALAALTKRLKQAFDPAGILDPLRFA